MTGKQVIFNSNLKLWLSQDYFKFQKLQMMLGGDYMVAQQLSALPEDAGILVVREDSYWFIGYYLLPRRIYLYPEVKKDSDLSKIPDKWIKGERIEYVLVYGPKSLKLLTVGKEIKFK